MESEQYKKVALDSIHRELGARMVPFAGYHMPVQYKGILQEHQCVRNDVGLFDVSHMGVLKIRGEQVLEQLNKTVTKNLQKLEVGRAAYSLLCYENGGTVDDLILYRTQENEITLVLNAGNKEKDLHYLQDLPELKGLHFENCFEDYSIFALQGPKAPSLLNKLGVSGERMKPFRFCSYSFAGLGEEVLVAFTGYTGEPGCELVVSNEKAPLLWKLLMEEGAEFQIQPIGLGARDTLRTEMGYSLYGQELSAEINPVEAGLSWAVSFKKDRFVGKESLEEARENPSRKLIALCNSEKRAPRHGMKVCDASGQELGFVTSGTFSPSLQKAIGLALVRNDSEGPYFVDIRGKKIAFDLSERPFYRKE